MLAAVGVTVLSAVLWAGAIASIWVPMMPRAVPVILAASATTAVIAALLWAVHSVRDHERGLLIRLLGSLWELIPDEARPPLLRSAR